MNVENVVPWVPSEIVEEEKMEESEYVGEKSKGNVDQIEVDLKRTILMIGDQKNVVIVIPLLE